MSELTRYLNHLGYPFGMDKNFLEITVRFDVQVAIILSRANLGVI